MADTFTTLLRYTLQEDQANINQWGTIWNGGVADLVDEAVAGFVNIDVTSGNVTLSPQNGLTDNQRPMHLRVIGSPGATRTITFPFVSGMWVVGNLTNPPQDISLETPSTSEPLVLEPVDTPTLIYCDGINNRISVPDDATNIVPATVWTAFEVDTVSGIAAAFNAFWSLQGKIASIVIPANNALSVGVTTWILRTTDVGGLPTEIQYDGPQVMMPILVNDDVSGTPVARRTYITVPTGTGRDFQFFSADPTDAGSGAIFSIARQREYEMDILFMYSIN